MMRTRYAWILVGLVACTKAGSNQEPAPEPIVVTAQARMPAPTPAPAPPSPAPKAAVKVTVVMTAATLADDCGGGGSTPAPRAKAKRDSSYEKADRACDQTSMQLSITAAAGGSATRITVKKIELFDDKGVKVGALTPRSPTVWMKNGTYKAWDQKITPGQELSVSYVLSQPPWGEVSNRRNRMYVLKAVVTVGGDDQVVQRDVHVAAPASLPPGVKT